MYRRVLINVLPIVVGVTLTYFFWRNNLLLFLLFAALIVLIAGVGHKPGDLHALVIGFVVGLFVEIVGTSISGYQSFTNPDFLGIPFWLPVSWAYGFLMMKRIGVVISEHYGKK